MANLGAVAADLGANAAMLMVAFVLFTFIRAQVAGQNDTGQHTLDKVPVSRILSGQDAAGHLANIRAIIIQANATA